jgi:hypothetical protein
VQRKRTAFKSAREKESSRLFKQLQRDAKPQRAHRVKMTPRDEELWKQLLRENPMRKFPGDLTREQIQALRKLVRQKHMATKKRKKRKNPKKGKMPAGLRKYWAKKRAKKAARKRNWGGKAKRRAFKSERRRVLKKARKTGAIPAGSRWFRAGYDRVAKPNPRKPRRAKPRKPRTKIIKTSLRKGTKAFRDFVAATRAKYGKARVL